MRIEQAKAEDVGQIVALLDAVAEWQQAVGIDMWRPGWFDAEIRETIANGDLYVGRRDGVIVGCFMLDEGSPRWTRWLREQGREPSRGVVGRLAVARDAAGQGLGLELLRAAADIASTRGIAFIQLECRSEDDRLRRYYVEAGFTYCGDNDLQGPNGEPWVSSVYERPTGAADS